ncbi:MAG TPA: YetF domain-containing protein [Candidatus Thermoplasmatota archaeon]|nr:YetF domain-containing protein [Candidatus Thermoplasmatota archaeon]
MALSWLPAWPTLLATVATTVAIYLFLIASLRLSGNRTLAKMRAFDFVVNVAMGSIVATTAIQGGESFVKGLIAVALLVLLQTLVAAVASRHERFNWLVTNEPRLLLKEGRFLPREAHRANVSREELHGALRAAGYLREEDVWMAILEANGDITVIGKDQRPREEGGTSTVAKVHGASGRGEG